LGEQTHPTEMLNLPLVRCASLRGYRELVTKHGGDPQALLATAGLGLVPIEEENLLIPSHCLYNALEVASRELDIPDFGLQLSEYQELDILGLFALMVKNADTLPQVLLLANKHLHKMHDHGARLNYSISGKGICLQYDVSVSLAMGVTQAVYLAFGFVARMAQRVIRPNIKPEAVYFSSDAPKDVSLFEKIFQAPVYFNQVFDGAIVDRQVLQQPYSVVNVKIPGVEALCLDTVKNSAIAVTLSQQLSLLISEHLSYGKTELEYYASQFQMSERSMQRKLKFEGQSFKVILDNVRKDLACRYIQQQVLNMAQITEALCFSDQAVFTRAFRRWYQVTPVQYRKSM